MLFFTHEFLQTMTKKPFYKFDNGEAHCMTIVVVQYTIKYSPLSYENVTQKERNLINSIYLIVKHENSKDTYLTLQVQSFITNSLPSLPYIEAYCLKFCIIFFHFDECIVNCFPNACTTVFILAHFFPLYS